MTALISAAVIGAPGEKFTLWPVDGGMGGGKGRGALPDRVDPVWLHSVDVGIR